MIVIVKSIYGRPTIYPVCEIAKAYAEALGTKTLTEHALRCAKRMGHTVTLDAGMSVEALLSA